MKKLLWLLVGVIIGAVMWLIFAVLLFISLP